MKITKHLFTTESGVMFETFGAVISFPDGDFVCDDISMRREDVEFFGQLLQHFSSVSSHSIEDFTADYISLLAKYAQ